MPQNKVAITGGTSATALWIARAFFLKGWNTLALCSRPGNSYSGLKKNRIKWLKTQASVTFGVRSEDHGFTRWVKENKPAIWVHHHHLVENYKSPAYDFERSLKEGIEPLKNLVGALKDNNCRGIILTGTYFEPGEGGLAPEKASLYGKSKAEVSMALSQLSNAFNIRFSKIVVPDPVGLFENDDRFLPQLIKAAKENRPFTLTAPDQIADHIPMGDLGVLYERVAQDLLSSKGRVFRPSGWVGSYEKWVDFVQENLHTKFSVDLKKTQAQNNDRRNPTKEEITISWRDFFEEYFRNYDSLKPWRAQ